MFILHGENTVQSRDALFKLLTAAKEKNASVVRLEAKNLDIPLLEKTFGAESLFGETKTIVIEELHSQPKSKKKDELIEFIASSARQLELILWEKRQLTATMLKKFPGAKAEEFKVTNALFKWLESLVGNPNEHQTRQMIYLLEPAIKNDGEVMCFVMLIRQLRLLLQMKEEGGVQGLAPFMASKLQKQAVTFSLDKLYQLYRQLLDIDVAQKTSKSLLALSRELELLLLRM